MDDQQEKPKIMYSRREAAKAMGVSERTIDRLRESGAIKSVEVGRNVLFSYEELARIAKEGA